MHDGGGNTACEDGAARAVAEGAPGHPEREVRVVGRDRRGDAGPRPERERVVAALVGLLPEGALAVARGVDDVRVRSPDVVEVDAQLLASRGQQADEEDVGVGDHLQEQVPCTLDVEVHGDTSLVAVEDLVHEGEAARARGDAAHVEVADRVA